MKREDLIDQIKRWWPVGAAVFLFGSSWATANYQIRELEKRIVKFEAIADQFPELKADIKALTRENWRRGDRSK